MDNNSDFYLSSQYKDIKSIFCRFRIEFFTYKMCETKSSGSLQFVHNFPCKETLYVLILYNMPSGMVYLAFLIKHFPKNRAPCCVF